MSPLRPLRLQTRGGKPALSLVFVLASLAAGCQKSDEHPAFLPSCEEKCGPLPGIVVGTPNGNAGSSSTPESDAGPGSLTGQVLSLTDASFVRAALYVSGAVVTADGASGSPVTGEWNGADAYAIANVARLDTNWVSVKPNVLGGDALLTYQAVQTKTTEKVDLALVSASTLDGIFNSVSSIRSPNFGQVILFFRSAGTGAALSGLHVAMSTADIAAYASATGWTLDDSTATTNTSGLVVFGNVDPANSTGTQAVTVTKAATSTSAAVSAGQFAVKVVAGAVTIATVNVQL